MSFRKRHKYLLVIFGVCIWLMIKHSTIPYLIELPRFIAFFFDAPKSKFFSETAKIIDIFASAYVTSLLFYYMVDYRPSVKQEKKANEIISPKLTSLHLYLSELISIIDFASKEQNINYKDNYEALDSIAIERKTFICNRKEYTDDNAPQIVTLSFDLLNECHKLRNLILNTCYDISRIPSLASCSEEIINILSELQLIEALRLLPNPTDHASHFLFKISGFGSDYLQLKKVCEKMLPYIERKHVYEYSKASPEEIKEWNKTQEDFFKKYPEAIEVVTAIQKDIKKHEKTNC